VDQCVVEDPRIPRMPVIASLKPLAHSETAEEKKEKLFRLDCLF
jgi:hypothetical protein